MFDLVCNDDSLPGRLRGGVVAIGNFDGVHLGHQAVIDTACGIAARDNRPALALTFSPHPRQYFTPGTPMFALSPLSDKALLFEAAGLQGAVVQNFDAALAGMSAQNFIADLLVARLGAANVVAGHDFHFGKAREGTPAFLQAEAARLEFGVTLVDALESADHVPVSSSRIRSALSAGEIEAANAQLGYRWFVTGEVQHGDKRGRVLGFPTANIAMPQGFALKHGIYSARVLVDGSFYGAAVHFGTRMQFGGGAPLLEAHLLGFKGDLYGRRLHVEFISFLRGEEKFETVDALVAQMGRDVEAARRAVSGAVTSALTPMQARLETLLLRPSE